MTATFASGGNVAPLGYLMFIGSGLVAGLAVGWLAAMRVTTATGAIGGSVLIAAATWAAPWTLLIFLLWATGGTP